MGQSGLALNKRGRHGSDLVYPQSMRFFYFFIFYFRFLQKYIFDLEICRNIPRPSGCRAAGTWPPGSGAAGAFLEKNLRRKLRPSPWGPVARQRGGRPHRPPGSGAAGPTVRLAAGRPALAAPLQEDRLSHPYIRVGWSPHPSFASLKF